MSTQATENGITNNRSVDDQAIPKLPFFGSRWEIAFVFIGGLLVVAAWGSARLHHPEWIMWTLCAASAIVTSPRTFLRAVQAVRALQVDIDVLMFVSAFGAAAIQRPVEGAFLLFLFGLGAVGEHLSLQRAESSLKGLQSLAPESAERLDENESVTSVPIEELVVGDLIRIRPFDRIPCDGELIEGSTAIDESTLTGEPIPVSKVPGDELLAGTLNTTNGITVRVTRAASESALARVIRVVTEARSRRAPVERLTERIEKWYAPCVLVAASLVFAIPTAAFGDAAMWFYRSMAFLTAASPCALAIGAPATYLCGIAAGARRGIVFKGGESIEAFAKVKTMVLDKTGTITTGKPRVHRVITLSGSEDDLLSFAASVESQASHPLADAIVHEAGERELVVEQAQAVEQIAGIGVQARVGGAFVRVSSPKTIDDQPGADEARLAVHELASIGDSVVVVEVDGRIIGLIGVRDAVRPDAAHALQTLRSRGLRLIMATGDHQESAQVIANEVGLDEVYADQSPQDKMNVLERLSEEAGPVAMIGDGANDAPALARASVSLSMGGAASDVAADNADIVLMGERMQAILDAHEAARFAARIMRQNLVIALTVILVVAPLAIFGIADLGPAVVFHEGSTVVVVLNALRQLRRSRITTKSP